MLHRLEEEKARVAAQANADAQSQVQNEVSRILSVEREMAQESLQQAIVRERMATDEERRRAQLYVSWYMSAAVNFPHLILTCETVSYLF